jgi:hypothetical protein
MSGDIKGDPGTVNLAPNIVTWGPSSRALLEDWHLRTTTAQFGHQRRAEKTRVRHLLLGVPVVILTTIVGTGAFAAINDSKTNIWKFAAGVVSILAAILASVQTSSATGSAPTVTASPPRGTPARDDRSNWRSRGGTQARSSSSRAREGPDRCRVSTDRSEDLGGSAGLRRRSRRVVAP